MFRSWTLLISVYLNIKILWVFGHLNFINAKAPTNLIGISKWKYLYTDSPVEQILWSRFYNSAGLNQLTPWMTPVWIDWYLTHWWPVNSLQSWNSTWIDTAIKTEIDAHSLLTINQLLKWMHSGHQVDRTSKDCLSGLRGIELTGVEKPCCGGEYRR